MGIIPVTGIKFTISFIKENALFFCWGDAREAMEFHEKPIESVSRSNDSPIIMDEAPNGSKFDRWWLMLLVVLILIGTLYVTNPTTYVPFMSFVLDGIWVTIYTTLTSFAFILIVGLFVALGRLSKNKFVNGFATVYVEIIRGIPILVQLLFWYFAFPTVVQNLGNQLNIDFLKTYVANPFLLAIFGLTVCYAAYMSEVYRAGIQSIPKGQMEAARSLGMSYMQAMRYIIIPQAIRIILPPVGNEFIALLKDSSLISVVGVADMTRRGREFMSTHFNPIETWVMVGLLYLVMTLFTARIVYYIERKTRHER
jgi:polar amino acid transport system permease protein